MSAVSWTSDQLFAFGVTTDGQLVYKAGNGRVWDREFKNAGADFTATGAPRVTSSRDGNLEVFMIGTEGSVWTTSYADGQWEDEWLNLGGTWNTPPGVVDQGTSQLGLYAINTNGDICDRWRNNTNTTEWGGTWNTVDNDLYGEPVVIHLSDNTFSLFAYWGQNHLYHDYYNGTAWEGWDDLGEMWNNTPAAASWAENRLDVVALGEGGSLYHKSWNRNSWTDTWEDLGGSFESEPVLVVSDSDRLDLFALGDDDQLRHKALDGRDWQRDWDVIPSGNITFNSAPVAVSARNRRVDVFILGTENQLLHRSFETNDDEAWTAEDVEWRDLGGEFTGNF
ncbi:fucose-specific lectin [Patellaria atrata CBS 101060]|uniref:Fucose-specific lectin n=1 Tax=Patellaria atrata CBS 101060 TaxID=1346257 RepID=A0A9P4VPU0_9PEZI|nr:fucose-specific lectin [Patellaria atrata CBS 101060]